MMAKGRRDVEMEARLGKLSEELVYTPAPRKVALL